MSTQRFILFLFFIAIMNTFAQQPPVIDRELFFGDPEISGAQISPDGKYISFVKPYNNVRNIWVKSRNQRFEEAKPLTADSLRPVTGYFWSRDSKYILFVQDQGGNENYRVYAVDPSATGNPVPPARDLTPLDSVRAIIYDVPRKHPDIIYIGLNDRNRQLHDVYSVNLKSGERKLIRKNDDNVVGWVFDRDEKLRIGIRMTDDGGSEFLKVDGDKLVSFYSHNAEESAAPVRFTTDGKSFYMQSNKGDANDKTALYLYNLKTNAVTLVEKDPENEVDFGNAVFSDITNKLIATSYTGDRDRIYFKDKAFEKSYRLLEKLLPNGEISVGSWTTDENTWIVRVSSDIDPGSAYVFDRKAGTIELLYRSRPNLPSQDLSPMKPVKYLTRDGLMIPAYLTLPKGKPATNLPVVLFIHGGPWARDYWGYNPYAQFLSNRGYAVLMPNFRGSTGYGKKFLNLGNKQWGRGTMQHDLTDAVAWLVKEGIADPAKVAICGGSYGGYATLAGMAFTPDLYAAGFSIVGPSSIVTLLKSIPPYWAPIKKMFDVRVGSMEKPEELKMLENVSPLNFAKEITRPLYVVQGANDPRVKKAESDQIVIALRDLGRKIEYMVAPDEGHGFAGKDNRLAMVTAMEQFFKKHLGGRVQEDIKPAIKAKLEAITVDISTVTMPKIEKATSRLLKGNGTKIQEAVIKYKAAIDVRGHQMSMDVSRTIEKTTLDGKAAWLITEVSTGMMGGTDKVYLDIESLLPLQRNIKQGPATIEIMYKEKSVEGKMDAGPRKMPISITHDGSVFSDGAGTDILLSSLSLSEGFKSSFQSAELMAAKIKDNTLVVGAKEKVTTPAGEFDAWKATVASGDGSEGKQILWLDAGTGKVVKSETSLPPAVGGGKIIMELSK